MEKVIQKLSFKEKAGYGFGDFASVLYWQTISAYLLYFYDCEDKKIISKATIQRKSLIKIGEDEQDEYVIFANYWGFLESVNNKESDKSGFAVVRKRFNEWNEDDIVVNKEQQGDKNDKNKQN